MLTVVLLALLLLCDDMKPVSEGRRVAGEAGVCGGDRGSKDEYDRVR